jgi:hypothetical protein
MIDRDFDATRREARPAAPSPIPGDPFPWAPAAEEPSAPLGATPSPADSGDPASFDLGGGD